MLPRVVLIVIPLLHGLTAVLLAIGCGYPPRSVAILSGAVFLAFLAWGLFDVRRCRRFGPPAEAKSRESKLLQAECVAASLPYLCMLVAFLTSVVVGSGFSSTAATVAWSIGIFLGRALVEQLFLRRPAAQSEFGTDEIEVIKYRSWKE